MIKKQNIVYLLGIGGIGMSALARYFKNAGCEVSGYDKTPTTLTKQLVEEGIVVHYEDKIETLPDALRENDLRDNVMVIFTPAIPNNHTQFTYIRNKGYKLYKRSEVLGHITKSETAIAVAGTHGKTTTSTLVAHLLKSAGIPINAFLGGISGNYNTNLLLTPNAKYTVVEADEYDRSFLHLYPYMAVVTSMDPDHLDIYGDSLAMQQSYQLFVEQINAGGCLIFKEGLKLQASVSSVVYGFQTQSNYHATNVNVVNGNYQFDLVTPTQHIPALTLGLPGRHNVENAVAAAAVALQVGVTAQQLREAMQSFKGPKRRFEYVLNEAKQVLIDDYAHHPAELSACINSVKEMYPDKKVLGLFQPHLYSRTRDFADDFARSLDLLDETVLLEIYPAREKPIDGINAQLLLNKMQSNNKWLKTKEEAIGFIKSREADVVVVLGAGDVDQLVEPLKQKLKA